jgi:hypothetical protein
MERTNWYEHRDDDIIITGETEGKQRASFRCTLTPIAADEILMVLDVRNTGNVLWSDYAQLAICLSPKQETMHDSLGSRTFINTRNSSLTAISEIGNAGGFNHFPVGVRTDPADPDERDRVVDGFVARKNQDGKLILSVYWNESARVDVNPGGFNCIHSHPAIGPLEPGDTLTRYGIIMVKESSVMNQYDLMMARLSEYGPN